MSGHSKWAQIKRKKAKEDAKKGKIFGKLARNITIAVRQGGPDREKNAALADAIERAKQYNMPQESIERAISRGMGASDEKYELVIYEGYGPEGVAFIVEAMTDNRNRTASEIRNIFARHNGSLGATGCVEWMFDRKGSIIGENKGSLTEEQIFLALAELGVEDVKFEGDSIEIVTDPARLGEIKSALPELGIEVQSAEITMIPKNVVKLEGEKAARIVKFLEALEDHEDVQNVYSNFDISLDEMEKLAS